MRMDSFALRCWMSSDFAVSVSSSILTAPTRPISLITTSGF